MRTGTKICLAAVMVVLTAQLPATAVEGVALLTNGNVLQGEIRQLANSVVIKTKSSEIRIPSREVDFVRPTVHDIYLAKSAKLTRNASAARANLVRWCLRYGLRQEAQRELDRLTHYRPSYPGLATLRKQIQRRQRSSKTLLPTRSPLHQDTQFAKQQSESLSKQTLTDFVRTVQPLLTNRCALAGCHGKSSQSPYKLLSSSTARAPQNITYRNLGSTLRQIGRYPAEQTLLWMSARAAHGGLKKPTLTTTEQEKVLTWIQRVNRDHGVAEPNVITASNLTNVGEDPFDPEQFNELSAEEVEALELIPPPRDSPE